MLATLWFIFGLFIYLYSKINNIGLDYVATIIGGLLVLSVLLMFYFIHKKTALNISGIFREKALFAVSSINLGLLYFSFFIFIGMALSREGSDNGGAGMLLGLLMLPLLVISNLFTFLFGVSSIIKMSSKVLVFILLLVILPPILYLLYGEIHGYLVLNYYIQ